MKRAIRSGLFGMAAATMVGVFAAAGCSADGSAGDLDPSTHSTPTDPENSAKLPPPSGGEGASSSGGPPAGVSDAGRPSKPKDGGPADAGAPLAPDTGDACPTPGEVFKRPCGICGWQDARCDANNVVGPYSYCRDEVPNGCVPGTTVEQECGRCGKRTVTCNSYCSFPAADCIEPPNACTIGEVDLLDTGCPAPGVYYSATCANDCQWKTPSTTCEPPPSKLEVPSAIGEVNAVPVMLTSAAKLPRIAATRCPTTITTSDTFYAYVAVRNSNSRPALVSLYHTRPNSKYAAFDTIMAAYRGEEIPTGDARKDCISVNDNGNKDLTGDTKYASLSGADAIVLAPGETIQVYVAAFSTNLTGATMVKLNVKVDAFNP